MTPAMKRPLRIGVLLNSLEVNAWTYKVLQDIADSDFCEIAIAVVDNRRASPPSFGERVKSWWRRGLFDLYARWDQRRYKVENDAFAMRDVRPLLPESIRLHAVPITGKYTDRFSAEDIESIRAADLDVLIRFGFRILKGEILESARYGVWSHHHGDNREYRGGPPLFWEVYERNPVSGTILQVLTNDLDGGRVIYRSWSATNFESLYQNRNPVYWKTSNFIMRCLRQLHERGWEYVSNRENQDVVYNKRIYRPPGNLRMLLLLWRKFLLGVRNKLTREYHHWRIVIRPAGSWRGAPVDTRKDIHIEPTPDRFYADPFILKKAGRNYVFFEDYRYPQEKGLVSFSEIRPDGSVTAPEVVLERGYHLSYPYIFERDGETYMIPETKEANRVELYRATDFPRGWQFEAVLLPDVTAVDATLHEAQGKLWLFCNIAADGASSCDELHLFSADKLLGPWKPHPCNPVVSDVRRARPAGRLFMQDGMLIRPSQDCSLRYGYAIHLNRVRILSENDYQEEVFQRISPACFPGAVSTHTLNQNEDHEVLDANYPYRKFRIPQFQFQFSRQEFEK